MAHGKVTVLCKVPGHVIGTLPHGAVLGRGEGSTGVEKTGIKSGGLGCRRGIETDPLKAMRSDMVPTVKSAMKNMLRAWISSMRERQSEMVPQWGSRTLKSRGE